MLKLFSQLRGLPIMSLQEGREVGRIADLVIDPETGKLLAYTVKPDGWWGNHQVISAPEVREVASGLAIVDSAEALTESEEIIRVKDLERQKIRLPRSRVETEGGRRLGRVTDFAVDLSHHRLERINVRGGPLRRELIIPRSHIVRIRRGKVLVRDLAAPERAKSARGVKVPESPALPG